jgi:hypothetical protein
MIITIIDTSKNQPKDLDSDNQINVSRLIVYLAAKKENIGSPEKRSATEEESRTIKRQRSTSAPAGSVVDGTSTDGTSTSAPKDAQAQDEIQASTDAIHIVQLLGRTREEKR